jgi:hypothetical protein
MNRCRPYVNDATSCHWFHKASQRRHADTGKPVAQGFKGHSTCITKRPMRGQKTGGKREGARARLANP